MINETRTKQEDFLFLFLFNNEKNAAVVVRLVVIIVTKISRMAPAILDSSRRTAAIVVLV